MGHLPRSRCPRSGCPHLSPCPLHARRRRDPSSTYANLYGSPKWKTTRARILDEERYCPGYPQGFGYCGKRTTDVDHCIALEDGGDPWDRSNLGALCAQCHGRKTADEVKRRARARGR